MTGLAHILYDCGDFLDFYEPAIVSISNGEFVFLQRMFYSLGFKMSELSDSVQKKRTELQRLLRVKAVKEIVESQVSRIRKILNFHSILTSMKCLRKYVQFVMIGGDRMQIPCLEEWTVIEEDYSTSLSETTEALVNASLRLPLDVDIKVYNMLFVSVLNSEEPCSQFCTKHLNFCFSKTRLRPEN